MTRFIHWLLGAAIVAAPASAQVEQLPFILQSEMGNKSSPQAFDALQDFADCVVKHGNSEVAIFLSADFPPKNLESGALFFAEKYDFCLRRTAMLRLAPPYLRGALIEAKYHMLSAGEAPVRLGKFGRADGTTMVANCLVAARPDLAEKLLATRIASDQQAAAYAAMTTDISACA